jgi:hypothetical protein
LNSSRNQQDIPENNKFKERLKPKTNNSGWKECHSVGESLKRV